MAFPPASLFALILRRRVSAVSKDGAMPGPHPSRRGLHGPLLRIRIIVLAAIVERPACVNKAGAAAGLKL
jgi:hypothetical protein